MTDPQPAETATVDHITVYIFGVPTNFVHESEADRWAELALDLGARCADLRRALAVAEGRAAHQVVVLEAEPS